LLGAESLAASEEVKLFEVCPHETAQWEWRWLDDQSWQKVPSYVAGVFEGAFRADAETASVECGFYHPIEADFKNWTVSLNHRHETRFKLTRFLHGRPSGIPDLRKPEDVDQVMASEVIEVEEVQGSALHVRTLSGKVVFSTAWASLQFLEMPDLLQEVGDNLGVSSQRLRLLCGGAELTSLKGLEDLGSEDRGDKPIDLLALVDPEEEEEHESGFDMIPENLPGEVGFFDRSNFHHSCD